MTSILDHSAFSIPESRKAVSSPVNGYTHSCLVHTKAMVFSSSVQGNKGFGDSFLSFLLTQDMVVALVAVSLGQISFTVDGAVMFTLLHLHSLLKQPLKCSDGNSIER